jgi:hypothetical protein
MHLGDDTGDLLMLKVVGYQFPGAEDPEKRFSWHMIVGGAKTGRGRWDFWYPALTCDETPMVSSWLRTVAHWLDGADDTEPPAFGYQLTEPHLTFRARRGERPGIVILEVDLDLEFKPPWDRTDFAGEPCTLSISQSIDGLWKAADAWDIERAPFPDGLVGR